MNRNLVRLAGPCLGAVCGLATMVMVNGLWGFILGGAVFLGCAVVSDWVWRRRATPEEIRQDLEDRVRNNLP